MDDGDDDNVEHLCSFVSDISLDIYDTFLDYRSLYGNYIVVEGSIMQCARLDA